MGGFTIPVFSKVKRFLSAYKAGRRGATLNEVADLPFIRRGTEYSGSGLLHFDYHPGAREIWTRNVGPLITPEEKLGRRWGLAHQPLPPKQLSLPGIEHDVPHWTSHGRRQIDITRPGAVSYERAVAKRATNLRIAKRMTKQALPKPIRKIRGLYAKARRTGVGYTLRSMARQPRANALWLRDRMSAGVKNIAGAGARAYDRQAGKVNAAIAKRFSGPTKIRIKGRYAGPDTESSRLFHPSGRLTHPIEAQAVWDISGNRVPMRRIRVDVLKQGRQLNVADAVNPGGMGGQFAIHPNARMGERVKNLRAAIYQLRKQYPAAHDWTVHRQRTWGQLRDHPQGPPWYRTAHLRYTRPNRPH